MLNKLWCALNWKNYRKEWDMREVFVDVGAFILVGALIAIAIVYVKV